MTTEVLPVGTRCSLACRMCYQTPVRAAGNQAGPSYDVDAMIAALDRDGQPFTTFGGEPLLTPVDDLERLWAWGFERHGKNAIQTSASIITDRHFDMIERYNVAVGISLEGPGELNDIRWAGSLERTREATDRAEQAIHRLRSAGRAVSVITTLNRGNASPDRLPRLLDWFRELDRIGVRHVNLHLMEVDDPALRDEWTLDANENAAALLAAARLQVELAALRFQPITDMVALLRGDDSSVSCIWNACDPYTTRAVNGINGHGEPTNCNRTNKDGVDKLKADTELFVRPLALYSTPQKNGGCQGCAFWYACKGSCPGEALGGDWRRRTEHCETLKIVFGELAGQLRALGERTIPDDPARLKAVEDGMIAAMVAAKLPRIASLDPVQASSRPPRGGHGDSPHGDRPHGDGHGDHVDTGASS